MAVVRFLRELGAFPANYYGQVRRFVPRLLREIHFEGRGYGLIQPFQQPERVIGFFNAYREGQRVTRNLLRDIASNFRTGSRTVAKGGVRPC